MKGIVSMKHLLADVKVHEHEPHIQRTAKSEKAKAITQGTRAPVNKQAAALMMPVRDWTKHPLPPEKPLPVQSEGEKRALAELKIAHNQNAELSAEIGKLRSTVKALKLENQRLADLNQQASAQLDLVKAELADVRKKADALKKLFPL